jgi:hypothetical protein
MLSFRDYPSIRTALVERSLLRLPQPPRIQRSKLRSTKEGTARGRDLDPATVIPHGEACTSPHTVAS